MGLKIGRRELAIGNREEGRILARHDCEWAHLTICMGENKYGELVVNCYPEGQPELIERGLRDLLKTMKKDPITIKCAARTCGHEH